MDKEVKFSISRSFTMKSLSFMLILSVIATVLGFGVAYNEHRNLTALWDKYDEAIEKIESCEEAISELSQQMIMREVEDAIYIEPTTTQYHENFYEENTEEYLYEENYPTENITADVSSYSTTKPQTTTVASSAVSEGRYYVTKSGSKYHIGTCSFLSKSKIAITMEQIKAEGYTPCSRCIK